MNELRWILLVAGALLIAAIYFWGSRSRGGGAGGVEDTRRPARFTGGATGFETSEPAAPTQATAPPGRIEPAVTLDDEADLERPAIERRGGAPDAVPDLGPGPAVAAPVRREPTIARGEDAVASRGDAPAPARREPAFVHVPETPAPSAKPAPAPAVDPVAPEVQAAAEPPRPRRPQKIFAVRVTAPGAGRFEGQRVLDALQAEGLQFGRYQIFHGLHADGRPVFSVASLRDPGTFDPAAMPATQFPGILVFTVLPGPVGAAEAFDEMLFTARALATHLEGALADEKGAPLTAHRAGRMREEALEFERSVDAA